MQTTENLRLHGASPAIAEQSRRANFARSAYSMLLREMTDALLNDPTRVVRTPAGCDAIGGRCEMPAAEVIFESFSGASGEQVLHEALQIIGAAARGEDVMLRAALWVSEQAAAFAKWHADDMVQRLEEEGAA